MRLKVAKQETGAIGRMLSRVIKRIQTIFAVEV